MILSLPQIALIAIFGGTTVIASSAAALSGIEQALQAATSFKEYGPFAVLFVFGLMVVSAAGYKYVDNSERRVDETVKALRNELKSLRQELKTERKNNQE